MLQRLGSICGYVLGGLSLSLYSVEYSWFERERPGKIMVQVMFGEKTFWDGKGFGVEVADHFRRGAIVKKYLLMLCTVLLVV